ncbi:MAG: sigma-70 family RNA polymerase sigma factor [Chloroflexi bacterium]|nr:sigma-70 family RNA polymerase sigma factor [Chloroflexota bacterium]
MDAIGDLYDGHHTQIFRYVWSRVRERPLAEDLTGEIFTRMVTHLPTYQDQQVPFRAWLYRIARNLIVDHFRKEDGRITTPLDTATQIPDTQRPPDVIVADQMAVESVQAAMTQIDPQQREVVILRFIVGMSLQEVAETLDKSVAAIKSLQHRGLKACRVALMSHEGGGA